MFDNSRNLVAVVDDAFEVLYANQSCCNWLDISSEKVVGVRLKYANSDPAADSVVTRAAGICPSPELFFSESSLSEGYIFTEFRTGERKWKPTNFIRLIELENDLKIVLVVGGEEDLERLPDTKHVPEAATSALIHNIIAQLGISDQQTFSKASLVGISDRSKQLRRQVEAVAANRSDCLIIGPAGSGREHIARAIFHERKIPGANLLPIHCAIADGESIQNSIKEWVFDQRNNKTDDWLLLLDVDRLSPEAQVELLGYTQLPNFHLRIIATAENELIDPPGCGTRASDFIQPLAMHLSVQVIHLEPLSNRKQDIPILAQYFVEQQNLTNEKQIGGIANEVSELFDEHQWPGNISELKQVVEEAFANCQSRVIEPAHLPDAFGHAISASRIGYPSKTTIRLDDYLADIERELIKRALNQSQNNKTQASKLLSISRAKLLRRCVALDLINNQPEPSNDELVDESEFKEAE